jgi:hypothetical protein
VDCFLKDIQQIKVPCEILPQVEIEIVKRLFYASQEYIKIVRRCSFLTARIVGQPLEKINIGKEVLKFLEQAFSGMYDETERKHYPSMADKTNALTAVRIVETALILKIREDLEKSNITMKEFFESAENIFKGKYDEFCDRKVSFVRELAAQPVDASKSVRASKRLTDILQKNCNVAKPSDQILLSQAICRMYSLDRWYAVVSTDYSHMINHRLAIDGSTLLTVSDPLYLIFHLDEKIDKALKPRQEAGRLKIPWSSFMERQQQDYVV